MDALTSVKYRYFVYSGQSTHIKRVARFSMLEKVSFHFSCTVGHKSHDPCFRAFLVEAGVITCVAHCTYIFAAAAKNKPRAFSNVFLNVFLNFDLLMFHLLFF